MLPPLKISSLSLSQFPFGTSLFGTLGTSSNRDFKSKAILFNSSEIALDSFFKLAAFL